MSITKAIGIELDALETFMIEAGGVFLALGILQVLFLLVSRYSKAKHRQTITRLREEFVHPVNALMVHYGDEMPLSAFQYYLDDLRRAMALSRHGRQALIDYLMVLKKSVSGPSADLLDTIYRELNLDEFSQRKLHTRIWRIKAHGVRELSTLNGCTPDRLHALIEHETNPILRDELLMALVRSEEGLKFLDNYTGSLSGWLQVNLHHYLALLDEQKLPDFAHWFDHSNPEVVKFAVTMSRAFRQRASLPLLQKMMGHTDPSVTLIVRSTLRWLNENPQSSSKLLPA